MSSTTRNPWLALLLAALAGGCALPPSDHSRVSTAVAARTGHTVGAVAAGAFELPPGVTIEDDLTEDEAVAVALWNNAAFQELLADLGLSRADLVQAGMLPNPTLSMLVPWGAKGLELTAKYPMEALLLRPKRVAAAKVSYEQTVQRLTQSALDLVRDVKWAFAEVALAGAKLRSAQEVVALGREISRLSQARLDAGDASGLEATMARVEVLQASEALARARHEERVATERLRVLLGMGGRAFPENLVEAAPAPPPAAVSILLTNALSARPDLRAAELAVETAGQRLGLARWEAFTLAGGVNAKDVNKEFLAGPSLDFAVPIVNQNQGGIAIAKANFEKAARHYSTLRDRIILEVREAHTRLAQAQESLEQWQAEILPPLEESVRQSRKAYELGESSLLVALENARRLEDGRAKAAVARADVHRAAAELERSLGGTLRPTTLEESKP